VAYTEGGLYSLFRRLRIKKKVPHPQNAKADPAVQQAFKQGA
jgi:transposase